MSSSLLWPHSFSLEGQQQQLSFSLQAPASQPGTSCMREPPELPSPIVLEAPKLAKADDPRAKKRILSLPSGLSRTACVLLLPEPTS